MISFFFVIFFFIEKFPEVVEVLDSLPTQYHDEHYTPLPYVVQILKSQKTEDLEGQLSDVCLNLFDFYFCIFVLNLFKYF